MQRVSPEQLTFDAQPRFNSRPPFTASVSVSGTFEKLTDDQGQVPQLQHAEEVTVIVQSLQGEIIAMGTGIVAVGFKDKSIDGEPITIREQKIKL